MHRQLRRRWRQRFGGDLTHAFVIEQRGCAIGRDVNRSSAAQNECLRMIHLKTMAAHQLYGERLKVGASLERPQTAFKILECHTQYYMSKGSTQANHGVQLAARRLWPFPAPLEFNFKCQISNLNPNPMPRRFVNQLGHQENIDQVFLASQKQLRPNRNGNLYLQVELSDRTGSLSARMWNAGDADYRGFEDGDFVRVEGSTQIYQGGLQLIATSISKARHEEIDYADFMHLSPAEIDRLARGWRSCCAEWATSICGIWRSAFWPTTSSCAG